MHPYIYIHTHTHPSIHTSGHSLADLHSFGLPAVVTSPSRSPMTAHGRQNCQLAGPRGRSCPTALPFLASSPSRASRYPPASPPNWTPVEGPCPLIGPPTTVGGRSRPQTFPCPNVIPGGPPLPIQSGPARPSQSPSNTRTGGSPGRLSNPQTALSHVYLERAPGPHVQVRGANWPLALRVGGAPPHT
jgi:hypothetical protein